MGLSIEGDVRVGSCVNGIAFTDLDNLALKQWINHTIKESM